jgi:anti-anti-sigma factor
MSLSFDRRRVGDVIVLTCTGRIVAGAETEILARELDALLPLHARVVLNLAGVESVDSEGLGLLVRYSTRARRGRGALAVCAVTARMREILAATRLDDVLQPYDTEADALIDVHRPDAVRDASFAATTILCVDRSPDLLAYLRELLKHAGYRAMTAANVPDALILLRATRPAIVITVGAQPSDRAATSAADEFRQLANVRHVVELPPGFASKDPGDAARHVLAAIRACLDAGASQTSDPLTT